MVPMPLRQIIYSSKLKSGIYLDQVLLSSKDNNAINGVSGLLWVNEGAIVQVLEGPTESLVATFDRIKADVRHMDILVVSDRVVHEREFGYWSMELRYSGEPFDDFFDRRLRRKLAKMPTTLRRHFAGHFGVKSQWTPATRRGAWQTDQGDCSDPGLNETDKAARR